MLETNNLYHNIDGLLPLWFILTFKTIFWGAFSSRFQIFLNVRQLDLTTTRLSQVDQNQLNQTTTRPNTNSTKRQLDQIPTPPNNNSTKYQLIQMTTRQNDNLNKRHLDQNQLDKSYIFKCQIKDA
jgi:hypothetical protein